MTTRTFAAGMLAAIAHAVLLHVSAANAADVSVTIRMGDPRFYGPLDMVGMPPPQLVYVEPVVVVPAPQVVREPIYVRVPPGHAKQWSKHCRRYHACDRPVYFVDDRWYKDVYATRYDRDHGKHGKKDKKDKQGKQDKHDYKGKQDKHGDKHAGHDKHDD
ncbi:MAG: hypothetical protein ABI920_17710 [Casimicrobiaceae bacterium]